MPRSGLRNDGCAVGCGVRRAPRTPPDFRTRPPAAPARPQGADGYSGVGYRLPSDLAEVLVDGSTGQTNAAAGVASIAAAVDVTPEAKGLTRVDPIEARWDRWLSSDTSDLVG